MGGTKKNVFSAKERIRIFKLQLKPFKSHWEEEKKKFTASTYYWKTHVKFSLVSVLTLYVFPIILILVIAFGALWSLSFLLAWYWFVAGSEKQTARLERTAKQTQAEQHDDVIGSHPLGLNFTRTWGWGGGGNMWILRWRWKQTRENWEGAAKDVTSPNVKSIPPP